MSRAFIDRHELDPAERLLLSRLLALLDTHAVGHAIRYTEPPVLMIDRRGVLDWSIALGAVGSVEALECEIYHITKSKEAA